MEKFTLFYDGQCPLCQAEILFLQGRNAQGLLEFVDISAPEFNEQVHAVSCEQAMANMHGRLETGQVLIGVPVFAEAYKRANLPTMAWIFSRPWLMPFLKVSYFLFAKYRHGISRTLGPPLLRLVKLSRR
jgi:predicted DCC family thiol-disulfide oxidoreductase YuxK